MRDRPDLVADDIAYNVPGSTNENCAHDRHALRWISNAPARKAMNPASVPLIENDSSGGIQLLQQVEILGIAGENRHSVFARGGEDQGVIQYAASIRASIPLDARQDSGENSGNQPDLPIGRNRAVRRPAPDDRRDLFYGFSRA